MRSHAVVFGALLLGVTCLGCGPGGPEIAEVEGIVTMDGKPLPHATVVFVPEKGRPAGARTDENGHYVLNFAQGRQGAIPGKNRVVITTERDPSTDQDGNPIPAAREIVPMKYNADSELTFVVEDGTKNIANFELDSEGPIQQGSREY